MKNVLFVCSGNTCRSPIAQGLLREKVVNDAELKGQVFVGSCGLGAFFGDPAQPNAIEAAAKLGADITAHRSTRFGDVMFDSYDLILTMTKAQKDLMVTHAKEYADKIFSLSEYISDGADFTNVADPFGGDIDAYDKCAAQLNDLVEKLVFKLK